MLRKLLTLTLVGTLAASTQIAGAIAEEIRIPIGKQANTQPAVDMPAKGMNKERVKSLFGAPLEEVPAKGQPPISRWRYEEFTVYFDSNTVIHCVRNFQPKTSSVESNSQNSAQ